MMIICCVSVSRGLEDDGSFTHSSTKEILMMLTGAADVIHSNYAIPTRVRSH